MKSRDDNDSDAFEQEMQVESNVIKSTTRRTTRSVRKATNEQHQALEDIDEDSS